MPNLTPSEAEAVVRRYLAGWASPDPDKLVASFSDDAVYIDGPLATHQGKEAIDAEIHAQVKRFRGVVVDVTSLVSDGATVMTEEIDHFELAGRRFAMRVAGAFEVNSDGLITRWRQYYDRASISKEIEALTGAPPPPRA